MSVNLSPVGGAGAQFSDNNGNPLNGGKLYTYSAGTTTPAATYTSVAGSAFHTNPIILNAGGRVPDSGEIWLSDNISYKFVLKTSADVLIATWDNINGINSNFVNYTIQEEVITATAGQTVFNLSTITYAPGTNSLAVYVDGVNQIVTDSYVETDANTVTFVSGLHDGALVKFTTATPTTGTATNADVVVYDPAGTGAVTTTVQAKLRESISVKDFGAVGDGVTDDTAAIQAALNSGMLGLIFPAGTYLITELIIDETWTDSFIHFLDGAALKYNGTAKALSLQGSVGANLNNLTIENLRIVSDNTAQQTGQHHLYMKYCNDCVINGAFISYAGDTGIYIDGTVYRCIINNYFVQQSQTQAIKITTGTSNTSNANRFNDGSLWNNVAGIVIDSSCYANRFNGLSIEHNGVTYAGTAIDLINAKGTSFKDVYIEQIENTGSLIYGIKIGSTSYQNIFDNVFYGVRGTSAGVGVTVYYDTGASNILRGLRTTDSTLAVQGTYTRLYLTSTADNGTIDGCYNNGLSTPVDNISIGSTTKIYADGFQRIVEQVKNKTSDYALTSAESGYLFSNNSAGGIVTLTLPAVSGIAPGTKYTVIRNNGTYAIHIDPNSVSDAIRGGGGGKYLSLDSNGASVTLINSSGSTTWDILNSQGTTSFEP